jgi:hypothetical protein
LGYERLDGGKSWEIKGRSHLNIHSAYACFSYGTDCMVLKAWITEDRNPDGVDDTVSINSF